MERTSQWALLRASIQVESYAGKILGTSIDLVTRGLRAG